MFAPRLCLVRHLVPPDLRGLGILRLASGHRRAHRDHRLFRCVSVDGAANAVGERDLDRDTLRRHARCAACTYQLPASIERDGCTVCSECGAAWGVQHGPPFPLGSRPAAVDFESLTDDRGTPRPLLRLRARSWHERPSDEILQQQLDQLVETRDLIDPVPGWVDPVAIMFCTLPFVTMVVLSLAMQRWLTALGLTVVLIAMARFVPRMRAPAFDTSIERDRSVFRIHSLCASCGRQLTGAPEPDGCTVCSECGAAWRLGPLGPDPDA